MLLNPDWVRACNALVEDQPDPELYTMRRIAEKVFARRGINLRCLYGTARWPALSEARREVFWRCRYDLGKTTEEIARAFKSDRSTVAYLIRAYAGPEGEG